MNHSDNLPITAYLVLSLLAEGEAHGYELQRMVHERGFRFWTDIKRSSIYHALKRLQAAGLVSAELQEGGGPTKRVFSITSAGMGQLCAQSSRYLSEPRHPRNELDLGVLGLPFLDRKPAQRAIDKGIELLRQREAFVTERKQWCSEQGLELAVQNFARPERSITADRSWLEDLKEWAQKRSPKVGEWQSYEYAEPPYVDKEDP